VREPAARAVDQLGQRGRLAVDLGVIAVEPRVVKMSLIS